MNTQREKTNLNRLDILKQSYRLMAENSWDAISVTTLEKHISQTRGAIFYFNKNKHDLFVNMIDELFLPVFKLSSYEKNKLKTCLPQTFFATYKTPFERVCNDLRINYQVPDPSQCLFNIMMQALRHYRGFKEIISNEIKQEITFINHIIGINSTLSININQLYAQSVGTIFLNALN